MQVEDFMDPRLVAAIREHFSKGPAPSGAFLEECKRVGIRALRVSQIRQWIPRVSPTPFKVSALACEAAWAAGLSKGESLEAFGISGGEWEKLDEPNALTVKVARLLGIPDRYTRRALLSPIFTSSTIMPKDADGINKDLEWACQSIQENVDRIKQGRQKDLAARLTAREEEIAALFSAQSD